MCICIYIYICIYIITLPIRHQTSTPRGPGALETLDLGAKWVTLKLLGLTYSYCNRLGFRDSPTI